MKYFPDEELPKKGKALSAFHKRVDPVLLKDADFAARHKLFCTKIEIAQLLIEQAIERGLPFDTVLVDSWYLSADFAKYLDSVDKDWVSLLKANRNLEADSICLKDDAGQRISFDAPRIKVKDLLPLIPKSAFSPIQVGNHVYWCLILLLPGSRLWQVALSN